MRRRHILVAIAIGTALASPGIARDTGSLVQRYDRARAPDDSSISKADQARITMSGYAACLVKASLKRVEAFLDVPLAADDYTRRARALATEECLDAGALTFPAALLRGALFAALYRQRFAHQAPALGPTPIDFYAGLMPASSPTAKGDATLLAFAGCVVRKDEGSSRAFVLGPTASPNERAALNQLIPQLGPCMPQGLNVRFTATALSGLIAEAFYKESLAASSSPSANTNGTRR